MASENILDSSTNHAYFMQRAFYQAEKAFENKEVPVGAVIVKNGRIIGTGYNQVEQLKDPTAHAEMIALTAACNTTEEKYLSGCTLYVTLEPCMMCAGAFVWSKIDTIVFGAMDVKAGGCGSIFNIAQNQFLNHNIEVIHGVMEAECEWLLKRFFKEKRINNAK